jgi:hypothetical protein
MVDIVGPLYAHKIFVYSSPTFTKLNSIPNPKILKLE